MKNKMDIKYNYFCSNQIAYEKIDGFLDNLTSQYSDMVSNPIKKWNDSKDRMDFSFEVKGFKVDGNIQLYKGKLFLDGKLPLLARPFSGKIENTSKSELEKLFQV